MADSIDLSIIRVYSRKDKVIGTAFMVDDHRILTCAHVVQDALGVVDKYKTDIPSDTIKVDFPLSKQKQPCTSQVIVWDIDKDIAVLEFTSGLPGDVIAAKLLTYDKTQEVKFRSFGFPRNFDSGVWTTGVIKGANADGWLQLEDVKAQGYQIEPGFSGGPIWDDDNHSVVGMIVAADTDQQKKAAFGISVEDLRIMLKKSGGGAVAENPYRGLEPFESAHAQYFFGRARTINALVDKVLQRNFVAVVGPSGSGKSSLIRAGLLPQLKNASCITDIVITPTKNPIDRLILSLLDRQGISNIGDKLIEAKKIADLLQQDPATTIRRLFMQVQGKGQAKLLVVIDQFEELFTQVTDEKVRRSFIDTLITISTENLAKVVIAIRADFYGNLLVDPTLGPIVNESQHNVLPLTRDELREVIEQPALVLGRRFDPGLVEIILQETIGQPGYLPLLEFALTQLWDRQTDSGMLALHAYDEIGRAAGAMAKAAEQVVSKYEQLNKTDLVRQVFVRLVQPGLNAPDTRRRATKDEFSQQESEEIWNVVKDLADARLVVTNFDVTTQDETVEVSHEALIQGWVRLGEWVEGDREFLTWRQTQLDPEIQKWEIAHRDSGALLHGEALVIAKRWLPERTKDISDEESEYIFHSILYDGKELEKWISLFSLFEKTVTILETYFNSSEEEQRIIAVKALQWVSTQHPSDELRIYRYLETFILNDPSQIIQKAAVSILCERGHFSTLVENLHKELSPEDRSRIISALAYARNLPKFGKDVDGSLGQYQKYRKDVRRISFLQVFQTYSNQFAVLFVIVYLSGQLSQVVLSPLIGLLLTFFSRFIQFPHFGGSDLLVTFNEIGRIDIGLIDMNALAAVFLYFYIRKIVINEEVWSRKTSLQVAAIAFVIVNIVYLGTTLIQMLSNFSTVFLGNFVALLAGLICQFHISTLLLQLKQPRMVMLIIRRSFASLSLAFLFSLSTYVLAYFLVLLQGDPASFASGPLSIRDVVQWLVLVVWQYVERLPTFITLATSLIGLYIGFRIVFPDPETKPEQLLEVVFGKDNMELIRVRFSKGLRFFASIILPVLLILIVVAANFESISTMAAPYWCSWTTSSKESIGIVLQPTILHSVPDSSFIAGEILKKNTCVNALGRFEEDGSLIFVNSFGSRGWVKDSDVLWFKELHIPEVDAYGY